jgi:hypothetical protein
MAIPSIEQEKVGLLWAQELFMESNDVEARLRHALTILGIPETEFYKFQKEQECEL